MKNTLTILMSILFLSQVNAQDEQATSCSKRDAFKNKQQIKSASLSEPQIAETEKYDVHFYSLDLAMTNTVTTVSGTAQIHAKANVSLDSALFELFPTLTISQVRVNGTPVTYSRNASAVKAPVNALSGQTFVIAIDYNGTPPTAATNPLGGSGMTNASSPSWGNQVTWSLSEPFSAYEWWPCKQSLKDKADSCAVKVTVPNACKAGSNGILENVVDLGNGTTRYEWKHRYPIDYYLISVAVAQYVDYSVYANPVGAPAPILIQNYVYNNPNTLNNFQADIDETADFLELFSELYGLYPFHTEKYGHCMAPLSGGMEHQTMTTQGFFEKGLTSHELGHQWWGNNVTCASWSDIWVNEGFASYSEYLMKENMYPGERVQHMLDVHDNVMSQPDGSVYVLDSLNESRIFSGRLTYDKGSAIIHTMRFVVNNDSMFFAALKDFQIEYKDSVAKGTDVQHTLESVSGIDLNALFNEWYFGEGYPTYSARWNSLGNDLLLEITHTTSAPAVTPTYTNPLEVRFSRLGQADTIIRFDVNANLNQYFVPNVGQVVNLISFDPNNWVVNKTGTKFKDVNFTASISEMEQSEITVYPNPTSSTVTINIPEYLGECTVKLTNEHGQIIEIRSAQTTTEFDLQNVETGVYFFIVEVNNTIIGINKILKK